MFMVRIESYGDIFLHFCEFWNTKEIFDFGLYGPVNVLWPCQRVIIVDKYGPVNGL